MTQAAAAADPFPKRLTGWVAGAAAACLVGSMVALLLPNDPGRSVGADSTSGSAIGHHALVDLLRTEGIPVMVSRRETAQRSADASLLLLVEPAPEMQGETLPDLVRKSGCPVLVVLPKWKPRVNDRPRELVGVDPVEQREVDAILAGLDPGARVIRPTTAPPPWTENTLGPAPDLSFEPQLVLAGGWTPIVRADNLLLAGRRERAEKGPLAFLSDPDLVENHGLHRGGNARLALDLVASLRRGDRPVLLDESLHGLPPPRAFWQQLFTFPLGFATLQAAFALALFLWAGMRRFGAPEPPLPAFAPGKRFLIEHTAQLLESGRHHGESVVRYAALLAEDAARRLRAETPGAADAGSWLARIEPRKGVTDTLGSLEALAADAAKNRPNDARAALARAIRLRNWRQEIVDGSRVRQGSR